MSTNGTHGGRGRILFLAGLLGILSGAGACKTHAASDGEPWAPAIRRADEALGRKEFGVALRAVNEAYGAALGSQRWEALIAAGGAYRRLGEATGLRQSFDAKAREVYLKALFRARQQSSVEGVLRAGEGFVALGDTTVAAQCVRIAARLAARDPDAQADVRAFAASLGDPSLTAQPARP